MDSSKLRCLDLFSGIGGISIALRDYARTIAYCDNNPISQNILLSRMASGDLDAAPIWDDVQTLSKDHFETEIDIITAGFPCQNISSHGNQKGLEGKQSGLFYEVSRLVDELRPQFVFLENVANITKKGLREVTAEISRLRYDCRWLVLPASAVGAPHPRKRWFMLAHTDLHGRHGGGGAGQGGSIHCHGCRDSAEGNSHGSVYEFESRSLCAACAEGCRADTRYRDPPVQTGETEPSVVRMADGLPDQLDSNWWLLEPLIDRVTERVHLFQLQRIKALGNAVVPQQARLAFEMLSGITPGR